MRCPGPRHFLTRAYLKRLASVFSALTVLSLPGCGKETPELDRLSFGLESEVERLDPLSVRNPKTLLVSAQIYEGLLGLDGAGNVTPALAEGWQSADNRVWTFRLRKNARFHQSPLFGPEKSRSVTAHDAAWSYTAFCGAGAYGAFVLADIVEGCADYGAGKAPSVSGLRVLDDYALQISLIRPEAAFPNRITTAWMAIFPKESSDQKNRERWGLDAAVGTGPFTLESRTDSEVVLTANRYYWDDARRPKLKQIVFRVIKNDQVRLAELEKGRVDMMQLPGTLLPEVLDRDGSVRPRFSKSLQVSAAKTFNAHVLGFNIRKIGDVNLRRAISHGVDRRAIVAKLLYGKADVTGGIVPPGLQGFVPAIAVGELFDQRLAREALRRSSYKGEEIELVVHDQANSEQIGQIVQGQLKPLGIRLRLTKVDFNSAIGKMIKGESPMFSMVFDFGFSSPDLILLMHFHSAKRPVPNFWQYANAAIDKRLDALHAISEPDRRAQLSAEVERDIMADAPGVFLFRQHDLTIFSRRFTDLVVNGHGHFQLERIHLITP